MIENEQQPPPIPPRRGKWGKRILIALMLGPLLLLLVHGIWMFTGSRGLRTRVMAIRASGEPILPADFAPPTLTPDQNGGPDIDAAGDAIDRTDDDCATGARDQVPGAAR